MDLLTRPGDSCGPFAGCGMLFTPRPAGSAPQEPLWRPRAPHRQSRVQRGCSASEAAAPTAGQQAEAAKALSLGKSRESCVLLEHH